MNEFNLWKKEDGTSLLREMHIARRFFGLPANTAVAPSFLFFFFALWCFLSHLFCCISEAINANRKHRRKKGNVKTSVLSSLRFLQFSWCPTSCYKKLHKIKRVYAFFIVRVCVCVCGYGASINASIRSSWNPAAQIIGNAALSFKSTSIICDTQHDRVCVCVWKKRIFFWLVGGFYYFMFLFRSSFTTKVPHFNETDKSFCIVFCMHTFLSLACFFPIKLERKNAFKGSAYLSWALSKRHWSCSLWFYCF